MDSELSDRISKLYHLKTYMDRYGLDVWIAFIVCFIFIVLIVKYYLINKLQPLKADWIHQRCNPLVIPFAGLINTPVGESQLECLDVCGELHVSAVLLHYANADLTAAGIDTSL